MQSMLLYHLLLLVLVSKLVFQYTASSSISNISALCHDIACE